MHGTAFTISVDLREGTTTGISASDRAATIRALGDPRAQAEDFRRPGHVFPLRAQKHGVLARPGHTEAASDLARLAGLQPAGALCEIVNDDGSMARGQQLSAFAARHGLPFLTIADLVAYRRRTERLVTCTGQAKLPTRHGSFGIHVYRSEVDGLEHLALVKGNVAGKKNVLVRVHSECCTGDILGSLRCDCGNQLAQSLERIEEEGSGVLVYLRGHEGRGIGTTQKIRAYALQDNGRDTVQANVDLGLPIDGRTYDVGAQILSDLGLTTIRVMSNNPVKVTGLSQYNLEIVERVPLISQPTLENMLYLKAKQNKLGHILNCL
jgi:3,4-dihydroxy 2-butanone 4-phosphate synthase/GTP cyclohydrolase II